MSERREPRRGVPRIAAIAVAVLAVGLALLLVGLAWRSNRAARSLADGNGPTEPPQLTADPFVGCTECHSNLDRVFQEGRLPTLLYTHEEHFAAGVSDCSQCHPPNTHEPDQINVPTMARCFTCHGLTDQAIAPGACETCHPPDIPDRPETHLVGAWTPRAHAKEAKADAFQCTVCHEQNFCTSCHGLPMPHPEGFAETPHVEVFFERGEQTCEACHPRAPKAWDSCDSCHHPEAAEGEAWRQAHPAVVKQQGGDACFTCHNPTTCATCHVRGKETFEADRNWRPSPLPSPEG